MKRKAKQIITSFRVLAAIFLLIISVIAISPHFGMDGVAIRGVAAESAADNAGII